MTINDQEVTDPIVKELLYKQMIIIKEIVLFNAPQTNIKNAFFKHFNGNLKSICAQLFNNQTINLSEKNIPDHLHQQFKDLYEKIKIHL